MAAPPEGWHSDPFVLTGRNGSLYGRGATDNKGPIMAVACAAAALLRRRSLAVDLVLLIEGEEECGSTGFENAVRMHKVRGLNTPPPFSRRPIFCRMLLDILMRFWSGI